MYVVTAFPNIVYAFDLKGAKPKLKWSYIPDVKPAAQGVACCDVVNRGGTFSNGRYIFNTLDGQTIALNAATGKVAWKTQLGNVNTGETMTMAPLVAQGRVYVGNSGGEMGVRVVESRRVVCACERLACDADACPQPTKMRRSPIGL